MYEFNFSFLTKYWHFYVEGLGTTVALALLTVVFGVLGGSLLALFKTSNSKILRFISSAYIEFIRGTPMMVQVWIIFYGLSMVFSVDIPRFAAGVIAMGMNSAAYVAEIIRSGIQAVDPGQMEAARSLGMTKGLSMGRIILPQAIKNILPALGNEFVIVIKESSIVSIIGVGELMYKTTTISGNTFRPFEPFIIVSLIYFTLTFTLSKILAHIERNMGDSAKTIVKSDTDIRERFFGSFGKKRDKKGA